MCTGETVSSEEQNTLVVSGKDALTPSDSTTNLTALIKSSGGTISDAERVTWEHEKQRLYQQLDDKVIPFKIISRSLPMLTHSHLKSTQCL